MSSYRRFSLAGSSAVVAMAGALLLADVAEAQVADAPQAVTNDVGEIVVTAQRKSEGINKVPISVTAVSAATIENLNIRSIDKLATVTPGLLYETGNGVPQIFVRGLGTTGSYGLGLENPIAKYVDGAYQQRGIGAPNDLIDLGSVEVLKGPQGALYGHNATGGAILLNTADPTDRFSATGTFEAGKFGHRQFDGVVNLPASDTLALRFAGRYRDDEGYVRNIFTGQDLAGGNNRYLRGKAKWTGVPDLTATLTASYNHSREVGSDAGQPLRGGVYSNLCTGCTLLSTLNPVYPSLPLYPASVGFYESTQDIASDTKSDAYDVNLRLQYDFGKLSIKSTTDYYYQKTSGYAADGDGTAAPLQVVGNSNKGKTFQQDVQLSSSFGGIFDFLVGAQYIHDRVKLRTPVFGWAFQGQPAPLGTGPLVPYIGNEVPANAPASMQDVISKSYSVFGEAYIRPLPRLTITAGGRYASDRRHLDTSLNAAGLVIFVPPGQTPQTDLNQKNSLFTPRFVVAYDARVVNLYASYTRGFKSGGFVVPSYGQPNNPFIRVGPEKIGSYEIGAKFVSPDRKARVNIAAFRYDYNNIQTSIVSGIQAVLTNAGAARGKGVDLDITYRTGPLLGFGAGGEYLDAKYRRYPDAPVYLICGIDGAGNPTRLALSCPGRAAGLDLSGTRLPRAPKWTGYVFANLNVPLVDDIGGHLSVIAQHSSGYDFTPSAGGELGADRQGSYTIVNMSGYISPESDSYRIGFYVDNLTNEKYYNQIQTNPLRVFASPKAPRSYGVRIRFSV